MRLTFLVLLAANALMLAWMLLVWDPSTAEPGLAAEPDLVQQPQIRLLNEAPPPGPVPRVESPMQPKEKPNEAAEHLAVGSAEAPPGDTAEPTQALCRFVGPFDSDEQAEVLVERLAAVDVTARVDHLEISAGPGYWVHIAPLGSRREALRRLAELQARGVDSYIIPRGELANGISLGLFSREPLATARAAKMTDLGIEAQISTIERTYKETWVSASASAANALSEQAWQNALNGLNTPEHKQNFCLHVAS